MSNPLNTPSLSGNWQFTLPNPADGSSLGGLQGGFLLQKNGAVTGAAVYSVSLPAQSGGIPTVCSSGSAPITGTVSGENVTLTATVGAQTYAFTGTFGLNGLTMSGTFTTTDGAGCGTAQSAEQWSAAQVPTLSGSVQGSFHSTGGAAGLSNRDFPVTGFLSQGPNIGASNATITGTLTFVDPASLISDYPCFDTASVNGEVSGASVILQIIGANGSNLGQIGGSPNSGLGSVTFDSTPNGRVLHSIVPPGYAVSSKACPGSGLTSAGDYGSICLALSSSTACQQPITLSPAFITFPAQLLGSSATQTITLTNNDPSGSALNGLSLNWQVASGFFTGQADFTGQPNFTETDNCSPSVGTTFSLLPGLSCSIQITFTPEESCAWVPLAAPPQEIPPAQCPIPLTAQLVVNTSTSSDNNPIFAVPITGIGASSIVPSTPELDFGAEAMSEASLPQMLSFTNQSSQAVQILPKATVPCVNPLPRDNSDNGGISGVQVVGSSPGVANNITPDGTTVIYSCDSDPTSTLPNFQITADTCTGTLLAAHTTCSLQIAYVPQPGTTLLQGLDYFVELNTTECSGGTTSNCEIDSGRFPVELKTNPASPLRMSLAAGLDFGGQPVGKASVQRTVTLFNDPADPNTATVNFTGTSVRGDYTESDDCGSSLAPGNSCTVTVTFKPKIVGYDPGTITITYAPNQFQTIYLRGTGQ